MLRQFTVLPEQTEQRLDTSLTELMPDMSRSHIRLLIDSGKISVNGERKKAGYQLRADDVIIVQLPEAAEAAVEAEDIPLSIVYEDADVIVIDKPKGMVVHPAAGHAGGTLVNALMFHCSASLSGINGELRPGIVHRIDKDTTGLIIACKNDMAHNSIAQQLKEHSITRRYLALVRGVIRQEEGRIDEPLARAKNDRKKYTVSHEPNAKAAITNFRVLERFRSMSLVECRLETGRTHQIRVHMAYLGHPLVGDPVYGFKNDELIGNGQYLHAAVLGFIHPRTGEYLEFHSGLPGYFEELLEKCRSQSMHS